MATLIHVEIHNFQSLERVAIEIDRYTGIGGRSNIGKSAIVRAIKCALTGATGTDFVRHGAKCDRRIRGTAKCKCFSKVVIQTTKMTVTWEKGDSVNRYTYQPEGQLAEVYNGHEGGTPEFLSQDFPKIKIGDSKELIQIPLQFEALFLLNESGPVVADVLSDVARLDRINVAMAAATKDRKDAASKKKVRDEDVVALSKTLAAYDGLDVYLDRATGVQAKFQEATEREALLARVDGFIASARGVSAAITSLKVASETAIPDVPRLSAQGAKLFEVLGYLEQVAEKAPVIRRLSGVEGVVIPELTKITTTSEAYARVSSWLIQSQALERASQELDVPVVSADWEQPPLQAKLAEMQRVRAFWDRLESLSSDDLERELADSEAREAEILRECNELGVCPTCSSPISFDHTHLEEAVA